MHSKPSLCANGCGFFGTTATRNLCSKCYKDALKREEKPMVGALLANEFADKASITATTSTFTAPLRLLPHHSIDSSSESSVKPTASRCRQCNKRVGICVEFKCRCGDIFCARHRYVEMHECKFNFKEVERAKICKENPIVKADKLQRI